MSSVLLPEAPSAPVLGVVDALLAVRASAFVGRRYVCSCCGWHLRAFTAGGTSMREKPTGYCPRCNAKARHRRIWLYLEQRTDLLTTPARLLHVSPKYALARRFARTATLDPVGIDLVPGPHVDMVADLRDLPFPSASFDVALCVHVLEEIEEDRTAMAELHRVVRPGGWALVSVPTRLDQPTYEDPSIVTPRDRRRAFGERAHVRVYGHDLVDRLEGVGFRVEVDLARDVDAATRDRYGLRDDENLFLCHR